MIGGGLKLYTKATSSIKTEDKGSNTVILGAVLIKN